MTCSEGIQGLHGSIHDEVEQVDKTICPLEADMEFSQECSLKIQREYVKGQSSYEGHSTVSTRPGSISSSPISESPRLPDRASSPVSASSHVSDLLQLDQMSNMMVSSEALSGSPQEGSFPDVTTYLDAWEKVSGTSSDEMTSSLACLASVLMTSEKCDVDGGDYLFDDCLADMSAHFLISGSEWLSETCDDDDFSDDDCLADKNTHVLS
jgi:hypothetical protein